MITYYVCRRHQAAWCNDPHPAAHAQCEAPFVINPHAGPDRDRWFKWRTRDRRYVLRMVVDHWTNGRMMMALARGADARAVALGAVLSGSIADTDRVVFACDA